MTLFDSLLEETLEAWSDVRQGLIDEVANVPDDRFDFRPTPETRSVTELIQHILEVALMMTGELTRPDTDFHRAPWPELLDLYAAHVKDAGTKAELLDLLRSSIREAEQKFRAAGELAMLQLITRFDGEQGTRLAWLNHGIAQEMYHRGQLVLYQRLMGIEPALTRRIRESWDAQE
ncbi:MAG: DinB family protein [Gemmatimonadota bacterium]|nr:MAG: DinB family protein [Gemmatimonadota bacterium]